MKIRTLLCVGLMMSVSVSIAHAELLKEGQSACLSEELLSELKQAAFKSDTRAAEYLYKHGCIVTKRGIPVSVIDTTWSGYAKVRAYIGNEGIVLWTFTESIQR